MKSKIIAVMLAALTLIILAGCGQNSGGSPENGTIDVVKGEESYAKPIAASVPENAEIPEFYVPVSIPGVSEQVYAFVDTEGITQLRVYARQERFENGVFADARRGSLPAGWSAPKTGKRKTPSSICMRTARRPPTKSS